MLSLVIWHAFFGLSGLNNDINVLQQSRLFNDPKEGKAPEILFMAHGVTYPWGYYLVDGMYPELTTLIKTISEPSDDEYKYPMFLLHVKSFAQLYDDDAVSLCCLGILQLVILGVESRCAVPDWMLRLANDRVAWNKYPWGSYVWPTLYSQLRNANVNVFGLCFTWILESFRVTAIRYFDRYNWYPRVAVWSKKKGRFLGHMVIPFFEGNMPVARLTPDDNEARSDCWISSKAYFDGFIDVGVVGHSVLATQYIARSLVLTIRLVRCHLIMGRPNLQTTIETHHDVDGIFDQNISNRGKREQFPSKYKLTPF
ncbi:phospholipase-like protein [Tanacetum coccineum]|uniref:Phospholipase-like protein n=1 Tax=Tanacetum coccineum TaxID=301880 RepID=A0ABQ5IZL3_9ASTR